MPNKRNFLRNVERPAMRAMHGFELGPYQEPTKALRAIQPAANRFDGRHAQPDVIDLLLMDAAARGG